MSDLKDFKPGVTSSKCIHMFKYDTPFPERNYATSPLGNFDYVTTNLQGLESGIEVSTDYVKFGNASKHWTSSSSMDVDSYFQSSQYFDATNYMNTNAKFSLYGVDKFTQEFWMYNTGTGDRWWNILNCNHTIPGGWSNETTADFEPSNSEKRYGMFYDKSNNRMYWMIVDTDAHDYTDSYTALDSTWNHIVYQRNQDDVRIYVNGTLAKQYDLDAIGTDDGDGKAMPKDNWYPRDITDFTKQYNAGGKTYINQYRLTLEPLYSANFTPGSLAG